MGKIKVLIADDIRNLAEYIKEIVLKNDKFEVIGIANDGQEEFDMINNLQPEIVFTDNQMPKMNGIEVIEKIQKSDIINQPKFILVTGDVDRSLYEQCAKLDIISVIQKPISYNRISQILEEITDIKESPIKENKKENSFLSKLLKKLKGGN